MTGFSSGLLAVTITGLPALLIILVIIAIPVTIGILIGRGTRRS